MKKLPTEGLFWTDADTRMSAKIEKLKQNNWVEVISGYWAPSEQIIKEQMTDVGLNLEKWTLKFEDAYALVRSETNQKRLAPDPVWLKDDYLPHYNEALSFNVNEFTQAELITAGTEHKISSVKHPLIFDIECYPNYFQCAFKSAVTGKFVDVEMYDGHPLDIAKLKWIVDNFCVIGFNSLAYDTTILALALAGKPTEDLKEATVMLIEHKMWSSAVLKEFKVKRYKHDHIDIMPVAPISGSLKIYGGRNGTRRMQDLPFPPETNLSREQMICVRYYCANDLNVTDELWDKLTPEMALRIEMSSDYNLDLRSKSDAQIAEAVIKYELETMRCQKIKKPDIPAGTSYFYKHPGFIKFFTPMMKEVYDIVLDTEFIVNDKGSIQLPERFNNLKVIIGEGEYNLQIGGLHSKEKSTVHISDDEYTLEEQDVTSYYPFIILNQGLFPQHLGIDFLKVYRGIVMRRLDAKSSGNKKVANSLKIVINGSFGKLGNKYSIFYAPDLLMQVTLTGQLALLMLIEALEMSGIKVVSANTDGVVIKCHKSQQHLKQQILDWWQDVTNFNLEKNEYRALYSRDVNNYIGVPVDFGIDPESKLKLKGAFAAGGLSKNPTANICTTAVTQYLTSGVPLMTTIGQCKDISNFVTVRAVKGGAVKVYGSAPKIFTRDEKEVLIRQVGYSEYYNGTWKLTDQEGLSACSFDNAFLVAHNKFKDVEKSEFLGKAVRWYYGKGETGEIVYAKSGNKVPKSDGSIPLMDMNKEIPADLDYDWYVKESESILGQLGV